MGGSGERSEVGEIQLGGESELERFGRVREWSIQFGE